MRIRRSSYLPALECIRRRLPATARLLAIAAIVLAALVSVLPTPASASPSVSLSASYLPPADPLSVSCAALNTCVAVGADTTITSTNVNGLPEWTSQPVTDNAEDEGYGNTFLTGVSCPSSTTCFAVGYYDLSSTVATPPNGGIIESTSNGGASWIPDAVPTFMQDSSDSLAGVSCSTTQDCVVVGYGDTDGTTAYDVAVTTDGGSAWTEEDVPVPDYSGLAGVSCYPSSSDCVAVGGNSILASTDGGMTWVSEPGVGDGGASVSCSSASDCVAVEGSNIITSTDGGTSWTLHTAPSGTNALNAISCYPSTSTCVAVGGKGIVTSTDGGTSWTTEKTPTGVNSLYGVSCSSASDCVAVAGSSVLTSSDGGASWDKGTVPNGVDALDSVSCSSSSDCVATGPVTDWVSGRRGGVLNTLSGGTSWSIRNVPRTVGLIASVSCPVSTSACVGVGDEDWFPGEFPALAATSNNEGKSWVRRTIPKKIYDLSSVSCPSSSECVAVGANSIVTSNRSGKSWTSAKVPTGTNGLTDVSCESTLDCVAVHFNGIMTSTDGGASWSSAIVPGDIDDLTAVSCYATSPDCVAVGGNEVVTSTDGGNSWTSQAIPVSASLTGVSCTSTSHCVAVGNIVSSDGYSVGSDVLSSTDGGTSWSAQSAPSDVTDLAAVSCPVTSTCFAVGSNAQGGAVVLSVDG
jgi:photosystem II stability/assembly factor-like uncharacterized protein